MVYYALLLPPFLMIAPIMIFGRKLVVFNPTTNQRRIIPREKKLAVEKHRAINIVFDPSKSDHYMIVCVLVYDKKEFRFKVYSSETGVWSETGVTFRKRGVRYYFERGVLWNGGFHWVSKSSGTLCFDLDNLCLRTVIPHPQNPSSEWCHICFFGESGRHLYFIGLDKSDATLIKVFSLKRDYSEWVVKHCIDIAPLITLYPSMVVDDYEPIYRERFHLDMPCFVVDEKEKETMPVISIEGKLIAYEINNMTVKEFAKVDFGDLSKGRALNYDWQAAYRHTETLACV
ncbi:F-box protein At5g07610-like [Coffea eugenioides]|uniref:F-box protein At5g07610-like n=1 Tax=Coffea eugenioides TaxID=49369 RepID=UPI000F6114AC|nr:F-box protein At5g07610-like [Coffea eugenioides]